MTNDYDYRPRAGSRDDPGNGERRDHAGRLLCSAYGCPLQASISVGGGGWTCAYHHNAPAASWPRVTERLGREDVKLARRRLCRLEAAIRDRIEQEIPGLIHAVQVALIALGADPDSVTLLEMLGPNGTPVPETPGAYAYRMRFLLVNLVAPPVIDPIRKPRRVPLNTAAIVSPEKDFDEVPF